MARVRLDHAARSLGGSTVVRGLRLEVADGAVETRGLDRARLFDKATEATIF